MNMPGFTAESSLYVRNQQYRMSENFDSLTRGQEVSPQFLLHIIAFLVDIILFEGKAY